MKPIHFGTDGWRGVIADDFTYHRVGVVGEAIGDYLRAEGTADRGVAIGYDNRFASEEFATLVATVLTRQGIAVRLSTASVPTPLVSFMIDRHKLGGGIAITASHNPAQYNGVKFKPWFAGSASPETTRDIEQRANALLETLDLDAIRALGPDERLLSREDFITAYLRHAFGLVDIAAIQRRAPSLFVDPLYGSSAGVLDRALCEAGCIVHTLHGERNPGFSGLHPEPIPDNLHELRQAVQTREVDGALASDGDGDRLSAMTGKGVYVSPHHVFALLLIHLVEDRGQRGGVVKTVSTTTMIDQLARVFDLPLYETPIGFKYISQLMLEQDILIGGEESGGIGVKGHLPERDATVASLLLVEMMAMRNATLEELLAQLRERVGEHAYDRTDVLLQHPVTPEQEAHLRGRIPSRLNHLRVTDVVTRDGTKILLEDGSWLLLRASGTEPVLRIYAESNQPETVRALLEHGRDLITRVEILPAA